jgi:parallel beta-helix repeat protein
MRRSRWMAGVWRRSAFLSGLVVFVSLAFPASNVQADQAGCGQVLTGSITLTNNLLACAGDGLVIGAGGITVDLNGHLVQGTGLGVGVRNPGHHGVTIRNGTIRNFDHGVLLQAGSQGNTVAGISFDQTELSAVQLSDADGNQVRDSHVSGFSGAAFHLAGGSSSNFVGRNSVAAGNGEAIVVEGGSDHNRLEGNALSGSSDSGIRVDFSSNTFVIGNQVAGGSDAAITMTGAPRSVIQSNNVHAVGDAAILLTGSTANVVRFNTLGQSADAGVVLSGVSDSLIKANTMSHAGDAAISLLLGSSNVRIIDNQASHSSDAGVFLGDGVGNVVRGNVLLSNTTGIEVSGGRLNTIEFNAASASLGSGIEVGDSLNATVFGNTADNNGTGGLVLDDGALSGDVRGNQANGNGGDGITISGVGTAVNDNLATANGGWGIYALSGVLDRGANGARGNAEAAQCYLISCSDGRDWVAPVRPPEPLDPLEIGLEGGMAPPPKLLGLRRGTRRRLGVVICGQRRASRAKKRGRGRANAKQAKPKMVCKASYRARPGSRRLTGRLVRDDRSFAGGRSKVRPGRRGRITMTARTRPRAGRYTLVLTFRNRAGKATVVRKPVRVR